MAEVDSYSTSSSSELLSPFGSYRKGVVATSTATSTSKRFYQQQQQYHDFPVITRSHHDMKNAAGGGDTSWIGARMSPIAFDEEEDEYFEETAPYRKALHEMESNFMVLNERSALLGSMQRPPLNEGQKIHPLWDERPYTLPAADSSSTTATAKSNTTKRKCCSGSGADCCSCSFRRETTPACCRCCQCDWGTVVWVVSGIHLACMGLHDAYLWYISYRLGYENTVEMWTLPWLAPPRAVLQRFGAFLPYRLLTRREWWRMLSSVLMATSAVEWILIYGCWKALRFGGSRPTRMWCWIYLLSVFTGQIWMMAWDVQGVSGGVSWGSCGVLSAASCAKPRQRVSLLCATTALVLLALVDSSTAAIGAVGTTLFGFAFYGLGFAHVVSRRDKDVAAPPKGYPQFASFLVLMVIWVLPMLWISFRRLEQTVIMKLRTRSDFHS